MNLFFLFQLRSSAAVYPCCLPTKNGVPLNSRATGVPALWMRSITWNMWKWLSASSIQFEVNWKSIWSLRQVSKICQNYSLFSGYIHFQYFPGQALRRNWWSSAPRINQSWATSVGPLCLSTPGERCRKVAGNWSWPTWWIFFIPAWNRPNGTAQQRFIIILFVAVEPEFEPIVGTHR